MSDRAYPYEMVGGMQSAQSGIAAAQLQAASHADAIANVRTTRPAGQAPYSQSRVMLTERQSGGVNASVSRPQSGGVLAYEPNHPHADEAGIVTYPGIDIAESIVGSLIAKNYQSANVASMRVATDMYKEIINLIP